MNIYPEICSANFISLDLDHNINDFNIESSLLIDEDCSMDGFIHSDPRTPKPQVKDEISENIQRPSENIQRPILTDMRIQTEIPIKPTVQRPRPRRKQKTKHTKIEKTRKTQTKKSPGILKYIKI
jgi:hypothetical protein